MAWAIPSGALVDLTGYIERAGIFVFHADLEPIDVDGLTLRLPGLPPIIVLNNYLGKPRDVMTLAHELGHLIMHSVPSPDMEKEANEFASALLIPADDIRPYLQGRRIDLSLLALLKPVWRVSMAALLGTAKNLNYLGPGQAQSLWKLFSARRYRLRVPYEFDIPVEKTNLDQQLISAHISGLGYSMDDLGKLLSFSSEDIYSMYNIPLPRKGLRLVT